MLLLKQVKIVRVTPMMAIHTMSHYSTHKIQTARSALREFQNRSNQLHTTSYKVHLQNLSMCCFIEQSDAYMQRSSSRVFAPAVNSKHSDAQLEHGKVYLKSLHPKSKEFVAARNKFCQVLSATSNVTPNTRRCRLCFSCTAPHVLLKVQ